MRIPNCEKAFVPPEKLRGYLLSESHPVGRWKAQFFRRLGFEDSNAHVLSNELIKIASTNEVQSSESSSHGEKYVVVGLLSTPTGEQVEIQTVWIIESSIAGPRFVTAYPA